MICLILLLIFYAYPLLAKDIQYKDLTIKDGYYFYLSDMKFNGETIDYSPRSKIKVQREFENGQLILEEVLQSGEYISTSTYMYATETKIYTNGQYVKKITYQDTMSNASYEWFYENGNIETRGQTIADKRDGIWTWYFENGQIKEKSNYIDGTINGLSEWFYENGNIETRGQTIADKRDGIWTWYFENGQIKEKSNYIDGTINGLSEWFYENGNIETRGQIIADKREGIWEYYYENGKVEIVLNFINSEIDGKRKIFYKTGEIYSEHNFSKGQLSGFGKVYYKNGNLKEISKYKNNEKIVVSIFYKNNGDIFRFGHWEEVTPGDLFSYRFSGNIFKGKQEGKWESYNKISGELLYVTNYLNGIRKDNTKYLSSGEINWKKIYKNGKVISCIGKCN